MDRAYLWIVKLRKKYSPNSDIWHLRRCWDEIKPIMLCQLNEGAYQFNALNRYTFKDAIISLWTSQDMIALKLITQAIESQMCLHIPQSCYHIKGHGGLKKAVHDTHRALPNYHYVMRSDIKSYYDSINFDVLMALLESYIKDPALLNLISKACHRTETHGGIFYDYPEKGIPMGSPLSPLLGAIALMPLDQAMGEIQDIFYSRFMDDWVVLTKSKTALRKVVKRTHQIIREQKLHLHPMKTYIGKISHGFNFLAYYFDDKKILPAKETIRRFHERANALYERPLTRTISRRYQKTAAGRDISLYQVNEAPPSDDYFKNFLLSLLALASSNPDKVKRLRRYVGQWARWLKLGLSSIEAFAVSVQTALPSLFSCWSQGTSAFAGFPA